MFDLYNPHVYPFLVVRSVYPKTHTLITKGLNKLGINAHASNDSTLEAMAGNPDQVSGQPRLHSWTLSQENQN